MGHVQTSRLIPAPRRAVFRHITEIRNLPEWLQSAERSDRSFGMGVRADFPETPPRLHERTEFTIDFTRFGMTTRSHFCVDEWSANERFTYRQLSGFFRQWTHTQTVIEHDSKTTLLTDLVTFRLKYGVLGAFLDDVWIRRDVQLHLEQRLSVIEAHFRREI